MASGSIKARKATVEIQTITIPKNSVTLNSFTRFFDSGNLDADAVHLFLFSGSLTAAASKRFLLNLSPGGQSEFITQPPSTGYSCIGFSSIDGDSRTCIAYYFANAAPTSDITIEVTHISIPA